MTPRVFRNLGANGSAMVVTMVGQMALVPIFLRYWPHEAYADWLLLMTLPAMLFVLNGGLGVIVGVQLTLLNERGQAAEAAALFRRMMGLLLILGSALVLGSRLPPVGDALFWLLSPGTVARDTFADIVFILMIYLVLGFGQSVIRAIYRASEVEYLGINLQTAARLIELVATAAVVILGGSLVDVAVAMTVVATVTTLVLALWSQRLPRAVSLMPRWPTWEVWRFVLFDGLPVVAVQAGTRCSQQGMLVLLNHLLDARAVLLVGTLQTVQRALGQFPMMLSWAHAPDITTAYARREPARLAKLVSVSTLLSVIGGVAAGVGVIITGPWLYGLWVQGADLHPERAWFVLLAIDAVLLSAWWPLSVLLNATKHHRVWSWFYVLVVMSSLCLLPVLVKGFDARAPFVLSVINGVVMLAFLARAADRLLRRAGARGLRQSFSGGLHGWRGLKAKTQDAQPRTAGSDAILSSPSHRSSS